MQRLIKTENVFELWVLQGQASRDHFGVLVAAERDPPRLVQAHFPVQNRYDVRRMVAGVYDQAIAKRAGIAFLVAVEATK